MVTTHYKVFPITAESLEWDAYRASEPFSSDRWASSDRGWLMRRGRLEGEPTLGHYLHYGKDHHRSGHEYCRGECVCPLSQPGTVHAHSVVTLRNHYFETVEDAQKWLESEAIGCSVASRFSSWHKDGSFDLFIRP